MFFVIGLPSCFPLPCFATGCHTFGLKVATAAQRPRNDTNLERFCFGNGRFLLYAAFLRGVAPHRFSNVSFRKLFRFSAKPTRFVIARSDSDAAILNGTICHPVTKYGWTERNRTLKERKKEEAKRSIESHVFCDRAAVLFPTPVLRHGMPYLWLKDCHGRAAASQ